MPTKIVFSMEGKEIPFAIPEEILKQLKVEPRIVIKKYLIGIPVVDKLITPAMVEQMQKNGFSAVFVPTASMGV